MTPQERQQRARLGGLMLSATHDPKQYTAAARRAFADRFERLADPTGALHPAERARRAAALRRAHFVRLAIKSAASRRKKSGG